MWRIGKGLANPQKKKEKEKDDKGQCDELQKDDQREPWEWMSAAV